MNQPPPRKRAENGSGSTLEPEPRINLDRLRSELLELARFGARPDHPGIHRQSFSDADMQARKWCLKRMAACGLDAQMDAAGNVIGRWETGSATAVLVGSHLDSVPMGGTLDGSLGVLAALECVRVMKEAGMRPEHPIEVIATSEEEGRFGGMFGAQALCGEVTREWLESARDADGVALVDAMRRQGLDPCCALEIGREPGTVKAFLELHIEQGPVLQAEDTPIGIVEGISGVANWTVRLRGRPNHAGTTPMNLRRDAFMGLADFAHRIPALIRAGGTSHSRVTIGQVVVEPGFAHTVPGEAEFSLVIRDMTVQAMLSLTKACRQAITESAAAHGLELRIHEQSWLDPGPCHAEIIASFREQAAKLGITARIMPSGAGHDTQVFARHTRAGMIFVPSIDGVSHSPEERTEWSHIEIGANLLLHTLMHEASVRLP